MIDEQYRVKVIVRNNLLLSAIEKAGFTKQSEFARFAGIDATRLNSLVALREPPINAHGEFTSLAKELMEVLGASPSDLWTDRQLTMCLRRNSGERSVSEVDIQNLLESHIENMTLPDPADVLQANQTASVIEQALDKLSSQEGDILRRRFGLSGKEESSLREIGDVYDLTPSRIAQLEARAMRKLRSPGLFKKINKCA